MCPIIDRTLTASENAIDSSSKGLMSESGRHSTATSKRRSSHRQVGQQRTAQSRTTTVMARGKRWQPSSAKVACLIGALVAILCYGLPCVSGRLATSGPLDVPPSSVTVEQAAAGVITSSAAPTASQTPLGFSARATGVTTDSSAPKNDSARDAVLSTVPPRVAQPTDDLHETTSPSEPDLSADRSYTEEDTLDRQGSLPIEPRSIADGTAAANSLQPSIESPAGDENGEKWEDTTVSSTPSSDSDPEVFECPDRPFIDISGDYRHRKYPRGARADAEPTSDGLSAYVDGYAQEHGYRVLRLPGDLMMTFIVEMDDFGAAVLAIDRINELRLVGEDMVLGLNIIHLLNSSLSQRILQQEVNYLKECSTNTIGIFVSSHIWPAVRLLSETLDYNIFPLPSTYDMLFTKAAHLLYELPWTSLNSSAVIRSGSAELATKFGAICRHEHLCLESIPSGDTIYILLGLEPSIRSYASNGTVVLVLSGREQWHVADIPASAYVITESAVNVTTLGYSSDRYGTTLRGSDLLAEGGLLLEVADLLNRTGTECLNASIECLNNWKYHAKRSHSEVLAQLQLLNGTQMMAVELRQKVVPRLADLNGANVIAAMKSLGQMKLVASSNVITNYTTIPQRSSDNADVPATLGAIFYCAKEFEIRHPDFIERHHRPIYYDGRGVVDGAEIFGEMSWQLKMEAWVAAGLTVSSLGILLCAAILIFLLVRVCMDDILEGHPLGSILLLVSLIVQFAAFIPFALEYTGYGEATELGGHRADTLHTWNAHCTVKIFLVSVCYCMTFSLLLCRAIMLASIGSEGGFLSHINGYIQSVICGFSTLVQFGLSAQLVIVLQANAHNISCSEIYYGNWFWAVIAYDGILLIALIFLAPFIFRSQRNYREGLLLVTGSVLCLVIWTVWIPLCMFGYEWREAAVSLGMVATALAVLVGIMIPRCFLMVRGIARSDLVQALPSLTSLAFAQANQYISEQSVYECVNPAMRQRSPTDDSFIMDQDLDEAYAANSEIPTLPLRGQRSRLRQENGATTINGTNNHGAIGNGIIQTNSSNVTHIAPNFYGISNPYSCSDSLTSLSPNKITRF